MTLIIKIFCKITQSIRYLVYKLKFHDQLIIEKSSVIPKTTIFRINGNGRITIGKNVELREGCILNVSNGGLIKINDNVFINDYSTLNARERVVIDEGVQIGQGVKIYDHDHDYDKEDFKYFFKISPVFIGKNTWIGSNVILLRGSNIGKRCIIGANTVIKGNVSDYTLIYENRVQKVQRLETRK